MLTLISQNWILSYDSKESLGIISNLNYYRLSRLVIIRFNEVSLPRTSSDSARLGLEGAQVVDILMRPNNTAGF